MSYKWITDFSERDHLYLKNDVPNLSGLSVFCLTRLGGEKNDKFFLPAEDILNLTNGIQLYQFGIELKKTFNPKSFIIGFSTIYLPPFQEHDHYRAAFAEEYIYHNTLTVGFSKNEGNIFRTREKQLKLGREFFFSMHNKTLHTLDVVSEVSVYYIMDDVAPELIKEHYPNCSYL